MLLLTDDAVVADPISRTAVAPAGRQSAPAFDAIEWRLHRDVLLPVGDTARRTAWLSESNLYVEHTEVEAFHFSTYAAHLGLIAASPSGAVARRHDPDRRLEIAIYPGSFAPGNWYHWLLEALPRIWLAECLPERFREAPLLIHRGFLEAPGIRSSLDLVRGDREVRTVEDVD